MSQEMTVHTTKTSDGGETVLIKTEYVTTVPSSDPSESSHENEDENNESGFFDSTGKVAGTFTAVGVVVLGLIAAILWFCCCFKRNSHDNDAYSDEEKQYSSDESIHKTPVMKSANHSANHSLKRDNSLKSIFTMLGKESVGGLSRNLSKKKLNTQDRNNKPDDDFNDINMFPITEFESRKHDSRLEPLFLNNNLSHQTFSDDVDYSRKLKVTNPDGE